MFYLSQLPGSPVVDSQGTRIGKLIDMLALAEEVGLPAPIYPSVMLVEGQEDSVWRVPVREAHRENGMIQVHTPVAQFAIRTETPSDQEISLMHDVLDKQVIDIVRKKTVRVNDICFGDDWRILGVDNTTFGLLRRLAPNWLSGIGGNDPAHIIAWQRIELVSSPHYDEQEPDNETPTQKLRRVQSGQLSELRPADIAEIVHQLTPAQGA